MPAPPNSGPEISFVIPVYNKAGILPAVIRALTMQTLPVPVEYIFVDDASTDASLAVLQQQAVALPAVTILPNERNAGPSIRLNQGAAKARGRLLCLIDADELVVPDAVMLMYRLLQEQQADMVHGKVIPAKPNAIEEVPQPVSLGTLPPYAVSDRPLYTILHGSGFVRMAWLVEAALFHAAGGCDERLFIQDESLPLRLAVRARRLIDFRGGMTYAPDVGSHLSTDRRQQHHDRFFAYYNMLQETAGLADDLRRRMAAICVSITWKAQQRSGLPLATLTTLRAYLMAKSGFSIPAIYLDHAAQAFRNLSGIRRPQT